MLIDDFRLADGTVVPLTLAYTRRGPRRAPTCLILHGYTGSHHALDPQTSVSDAGWARAWAGPGKAVDSDACQVITVNLPGSAYGSEWPGARHTYASVSAMAWAIDSLACRLGISRIAGVIGYSFGGYVAMQLKADYPQRIGRVLALCSAWQGRGHTDELDRLRSLDTPAKREAFRKAVLLRSGLGAYAERADDSAVRREYARLKAWAGEFSAQALWRLRAAAIGFDLGQCPADTQLLYASSDTLFPEPEPLPSNASVINTDLGHQSPLYEPMLWAPYIDQWWNTVIAQSRSNSSESHSET